MFATFATLCFVGGTLLGGATSATASLRTMDHWTIVVDDDAIPSERYAAEEFKALFRSATGAELAIAPKPGKGGAIYIGVGKAMRAHPMGFAVDALGEEELRIRIGREALFIAGGRPRGTLYGVYEFFERYVGVRFLTHDHTYLPEGVADAPIPLVDYQYAPPFSFRWSYYGENGNAAFAARLRNNTVTPDERLGGSTPQRLIGHSVASYLPPSVYGKDHPEYFALVDGVRKLDVAGGGPQLCVTNPEVLEKVAEAVLLELDAHPAQEEVSISQMDNGAYCHCPNCQAVAEREDSQMGPHLAFVNSVAERVAQKHPGVRVGTLAYQYTRKPPKTIHARDNVVIQLCSIECCTLHAINDPACIQNHSFCADLAGWKEKSDNIRIWNYNTNFRGYELPFPNFNAIARNVQFFLDNHVQGVFMQAAGNGMSCEMSDLRNYVMSRSLWRPTDDCWALIDEFCRLHYAESATPILAYEHFLHHNAEVRGVHPGCFPVEGEVGLDAEVARQSAGYFDEALKAARSDGVRQRVEKASMPVLKALIATAPMHVDQGRYKIDASAIGADTIDRYMALCKQFGVTMSAEDTPVGRYFQEIDELRQGMAAVTLENRVWRVVLLPEQDGRVVEMTYKKTGRDLVAAPTRSFNRWRSHEEWLNGNGQNVFSFTAQTQDRAVVLSAELGDGSILRRTVSLASDNARTISFRTELSAKGPQTNIEFLVHPEYDAVTNSEDPNTIALYAKEDEWVHINKDWQISLELPPGSTTPAARGGRVAYFNRGEGFGVEQVFDPKAFARAEIFWGPGRRQVSLMLRTTVTTLAPGQSLRYGYDVAYLDKAPKDAAPKTPKRPR